MGVYTTRDKKEALGLYQDAARMEELTAQEIATARAAQYGRGITYGDAPRGGGSPRGLEVFAARVDGLERILAEDTARRLEAYQAVRECISTCRGVAERAVLTERYLTTPRPTFASIGEKLGYSEKYVTNVHSKGVQDMTLTPRAAALLLERRPGNAF